MLIYAYMHIIALPDEQCYVKHIVRTQLVKD